MGYTMDRMEPNGKCNFCTIDELPLALVSIPQWATSGMRVLGNHPLLLNSLYWDISAQVVYKELVFAGYYTKAGRTIYNETEQLSGDNMGLTLMWNKNNWTLYAQMLYVGFKEGDTYRTTTTPR